MAPPRAPERGGGRSADVHRRVARVVTPRAAEAARVAVVVWLALAALGQPASFEWSAPPGCPEAEALQGELAARLGASPWAPLRIEARVVELPGGRWRLVLSAEGAEGRVIEAESCRAIADAAVVMAAMALRSAPRPEPPAPRWGVALDAAAGVQLGALPGPALALSIDAVLEHEAWRWSAFAGATTALPRSGLAGGRTDAGATLSIWAGRVGACWRADFEALAGGACAHVELGRLGGAGFGTQADVAGGALWLAAAAGPSLRYAVGSSARWRLMLDVRAVLPLVRPLFVLDGVGEVDSPSALGLAATAGVEMRIP